MSVEKIRQSSRGRKTMTNKLSKKVIVCSKVGSAMNRKSGQGVGWQKRRQGKIKASEETPSIGNDWNKDFKEVRKVGDWPCEYQDKNVQHRVSFQPGVSKDEASLVCLKNTEQAMWVELSEVSGGGG